MKSTRQEVERKQLSELTGRVNHIVAGLRILRGIGGEDTFGANYATQSQLTRRAGVATALAGVDHVVGRVCPRVQATATRGDARAVHTVAGAISSRLGK